MNPLATISRRLARKVLRGIIKLSYDDEEIQHLQIATLAGDLWDKIPRAQEYGYTSRPHDGAEAVAVFLDEHNGVVIAVDDRRYRLKGLAKGEVALYDDTGNKVHLKRGGNMHLVAPNKLTVETPWAHFTGKVTAVGNITDSFGVGGISMAQMRTTYNDHHHNGGAEPDEKML